MAGLASSRAHGLLAFGGRWSEPARPPRIEECRLQRRLAGAVRQAWPVIRDAAIRVHLFGSRLMTAEIKTAFTAVDAQGHHYVVNVWQEHDAKQPSGDPSGAVSESLFLRTTCGEHLNRLSKGKYQGVQTGAILTSDDDNAP